MFNNTLTKYIKSTEYKPQPSYEGGDPWDWAIGRDIEAHEMAVELCWDYLRTGKKYDFYSSLPQAGNTEHGYEIMYLGPLAIEGVEISKHELKAYSVFHYISKYLEEKEYEYVTDWIVEYQGEQIGLGIYTPDMLYSFSSQTYDELKRNRVWMLKNMINHTIEHSGIERVHILAGCFGNCKPMTKEYERDRISAIIKRFGKYEPRIMEKVFYYEHTGKVQYKELFEKYQF